MIVDLNGTRRKKQQQKEYADLISRAVRILWLEYSEADVLRKREILFSLRHLHRALPPDLREELWQEWYRWLDEFEEEEIACGERAESDRVYVWGPHVRELM